MIALKKEMREKRLTIKMLSDILGVSQVTINNWIWGKCSPNFVNMDKLSKIGFSDVACLKPSKNIEV